MILTVRGSVRVAGSLEAMGRDAPAAWSRGRGGCLRSEAPQRSEVREEAPPTQAKGLGEWWERDLTCRQ